MCQFWLRDVIITVSISIWILKKLVEGNPFPLRFFEKFKFPSVLWPKWGGSIRVHFWICLSLGLNNEIQNLELLKRQKKPVFENHRHERKLFSDRNSSFSVFFERTYFFVTKHLPIRRSFLKIFLFEKRTFGFKAPPFHESLLYQKNCFRHVVEHI